MQRYVAMLREHKHVIISGPASSGKSCVASKLAEMILTNGKSSDLNESGNVKRFKLTRDVDDTCLSEIKDTCGSISGSGHVVVVVDNLEHVKNLDCFLQELSSSSSAHGTFIIGRVFFYNCHRVKLLLFSLELSFRSLLHCRQTSK